MCMWHHSHGICMWDSPVHGIEPEFLKAAAFYSNAPRFIQSLRATRQRFFFLMIYSRPFIYCLSGVHGRSITEILFSGCRGTSAPRQIRMIAHIAGPDR